MKLIKIISEANEKEHDYGCVMLEFDCPEFLKLQDGINPDDLAKDLKTDFHCTLLYGLHDEEIDVSEIESVLDKYTFYTCKAHNFSLFENEEYDVIKLDVEGDSLSDCNRDLKEFPYTNEYPKYHPHVTIAYVKSGKGQKYIDKFKGYEDSGYWLAPQYATYSMPNGEKKRINIRID